MPAAKKRSKKPPQPTYRHGVATTEELKTKFLMNIARTAHITRSAELSGITRETHYAWLKEDPEYKKRFEEAWRQGYDVLEEEMQRRAFEGFDYKLMYDEEGNLVSIVRGYSDTLAMFLAKGNIPRKFVDRSEVTTNNGGPAGRFLEMSNKELDELIERTERVGSK